jgi:hypothetical protein
MEGSGDMSDLMNESVDETNPHAHIMNLLP